mmetsp:Transcript_36249/g.116739  ORF Transcript_36249/g.116739 Transcript_36249/m.116739 type:complete len:227 (+) Transcript_36249:138-818(+)
MPASSPTACGGGGAAATVAARPSKRSRRLFDFDSRALGCFRTQASSLLYRLRAAAACCPCASSRACFASRKSSYEPRCLQREEPWSSTISRATAERKARSCVTSSTAVSRREEISASSQPMPKMSRWLVGSSSKSTSGFASSAAARASRLRCPPDSDIASERRSERTLSRSHSLRISLSSAHAPFASIASLARCSRAAAPTPPPASTSAAAALNSRSAAKPGSSEP